MRKSKASTSIISFDVPMILVGVLLFSASASRFPAVSSGPLLSGVNQPPSSRNPQKQQSDHALQDFKARFPMTDYDSPEPANPIESDKRRNRNKHYDGKRRVMRDPYASTSGVTEDDELFFKLPAFPVAQSDVVFTADVLNAKAHLSNNKNAVYSEFDVEVNDVLKGNLSSLSQGRSISVSRIGGMVRYASGQNVLYSTAGQNMPTVGKRYLFFVKTTNDPDSYEVVTAYEIGPQQVSPLDDGPAFRAFNHAETAVFLNKVRDAIANKN